MSLSDIFFSNRWTVNHKTKRKRKEREVSYCVVFNKSVYIECSIVTHSILDNIKHVLN